MMPIFIIEKGKRKERKGVKKKRDWLSLDIKNIHSLIVQKIKTKILWFYYKCAKIEHAQKQELEATKMETRLLSG